MRLGNLLVACTVFACSDRPSASPEVVSPPAPNDAWTPRAGERPPTPPRAAARRSAPTPSLAQPAAAALTDGERQALRDALDDEYKAWATYDQIIRDLGPVRPFINIREAEARHIEALRTLFERYQLALPDNPWPGRVKRFASRGEACQGGVEAEVANVALYGRLLRSTTRQDILTVFDNLRRASQERHLPAFQRCARRG